MQTNELTPSAVRRLADVRPPSGKVLSLYLNLDPSEFGTAPARASAIGSLLDEAHRRVEEEASGLSHEEREALRADLERARQYFSNGDFAKGAHGVAVFAAGTADLFDSFKLPRPVDSGVAIADTPYIAPLAELGASASWCVLLVSRKTGRILRGSAEALVEAATIFDDVHGRHSQGGWSQARFQRSVEKETEDHVVRVANALFRNFKRRPFDRLLIACPEGLEAEVLDELHDYVRKHYVGRIDVDVENTTTEQVLAAAKPAMEAEDRRREREALDRFAEGVGAGGRGAAGLEPVLTALHERRVEILLYEPGFTASGARCPQCGWMTADGARRCPADETDLATCDDVVETAIEAAVAQSAEALPVRHFQDLGPHGRIGAVLRF
jgi:peptide chain release factor subunit 1